MSRQPEYDYPLVTESGETFLTSQQLSRFVRERCGDEVGRFIESVLQDRESKGDARERLKRIYDLLCDIDISEIENNITRAIDEVEKVIA